jgi:hypothetical protein
VHCCGPRKRDCLGSAWHDRSAPGTRQNHRCATPHAYPTRSHYAAGRHGVLLTINGLFHAHLEFINSFTIQQSQVLVKLKLGKPGTKLYTQYLAWASDINDTPLSITAADAKQFCLGDSGGGRRWGRERLNQTPNMLILACFRLKAVQ